MQEKWSYKAIPNLLGGLDQSKQPDALADNQCVMLRDVKITNGMLVSSNGYTQYGTSTGINGAFVQDLQATYQFNRRNGTSELICISIGSVHKYNAALNKWILVAGALETTTTAAYTAGATVFAVAAIPVGLVVGNTLCIVLDNTDIHFSTITVIAGLNITISGTGIPVGRTVASGSRVYKPVGLNGNVANTVSLVHVPGSDWVVFTNGIDPPKYWNGTSCLQVPGLPSAGNTVCRSVALYNTALFLIGTTEGGVAYPQRVRRSNQTDPTDWVGGTAGYDDLLDSSDAVMCGRLLGPYLIIYKSRSIIRCSFIGSSGFNYQYETMVTHEGAITPSSVCTVKDRHVFIGHNNIYEYAGDFTIKAIGDQIRPTLFSSGKNVSPTYDYVMFIMYIEAFDEVWVFYPRLDFANSACNYAFRYHVGTGIWYDSYFDLPVRCGAVYRPENEESELNFHLCGYTFKKIYAYDPSTYNGINGFPVPFIVESKDFIMTDGQFRFDMIEMNIQGTAVTLAYSTDSGVTYTTLATITQAVQGKIRVHKQFVCNKVRFKWTGSSNNFKLSWFGFSYKNENLYISGSNTY